LSFFLGTRREGIEKKREARVFLFNMLSMGEEGESSGEKRGSLKSISFISTGKEKKEGKKG